MVWHQAWLPSPSKLCFEFSDYPIICNSDLQVLSKRRQITLPLKYKRLGREYRVFCVASEGFEPPKAEPADLQSDPFGRLGN